MSEIEAACSVASFARAFEQFYRAKCVLLHTLAVSVQEAEEEAAFDFATIASALRGNVPFRVDLSRKEEVAVSPGPERISGAKPEGPP